VWDVGGPITNLNGQNDAQLGHAALSTPLPTKGIPLGRGKIADPQSDIVRIPRLPHEEFDCRKLQMAENYAPLVRFQLGAQIMQPTASQRHLQKTPATRRGTIERRKETGALLDKKRSPSPTRSPRVRRNGSKPQAPPRISTGHEGSMNYGFNTTKPTGQPTTNTGLGAQQSHITLVRILIV
jgi:hypothetical protein